MSVETISAIESAVQAHIDERNRDQDDVPGYVTGVVVLVEESAIGDEGHAIYANRYITGATTSPNTATGLIEWGSTAVWADLHDGDDDDD